MIKYISFIFAFALVVAVSCKKSQDEDFEETFQDDSVSEFAFNDALKVVESSLADSSLTKNASFSGPNFGSCAVVTINPPAGDPSFPKTIEVNFGSTGCKDAYGIHRKGKIIATITDKYRNVGSVTTLTTQNYYVEDRKVEGTKTVTNLGRNAKGNLHYSVEITNGKITDPSGEFRTFESSRIREWVAGESTKFDPFDDVYLITGTAEGVTRKGRNYTMTIIIPLRVQLNCRWITQGTLEVQPEDLKTRTVDFGTGSCDNDAVVSVGGKTYSIKIGR